MFLLQHQNVSEGHLEPGLLPVTGVIPKRSKLCTSKTKVVVRPTHFGSHHPGFLSFGSQHNLFLRNDGMFSTNLNYGHIVRSNLTKSQEVQADLK